MNQPAIQELVNQLQVNPAYRQLQALAIQRYNEQLEIFVQTAPASEFLRGRVLEAREFVLILQGQS
jgi:hypothetical protein